MLKVLIIKGSDDTLIYLENDVSLMQKAFTKINAEVIIAPSNKGELIEKLSDIFDEAKQIDDIIIYFTGHAQLSKGKLSLKINDYSGSNKSYINLSDIYGPSENSNCKSVTLILDCCHAGAAEDIDTDLYKCHMFLACEKLNQTHEIEEFESSLFTYSIYQSLYELPISSYKNNKITLQELSKKAISYINKYNEKNENKYPTPRLIENVGNSLVLYESSNKQVDENELKQKSLNYTKLLMNCIENCSEECANDYTWCDFIPRLDSNIQKYVTPTIKSFISKTDPKTQKLDVFFTDWLNDKNCYLSILGNMGVGKSFACVFLTHMICKSNQIDETNYSVPIIVSLVDLSKELKKKTPIENIIIKYTHNFFSKKEVEALIRRKNLIFIMDGFDEISGDSSINSIIKNFTNLERILELKSKSLITCRTHYFSNQEELENVLLGKISGTDLSLKLLSTDYNFAVSELQEFSEQEILEMIEKLSPDTDPLEVWNKIKLIYDIKDISKRAIILKMIIRTLPELEKIEDEIYPSTLYRVYTKSLLLRELKVRKNSLQLEEKEDFISYIAWLMWKYDSLVINYRKFNEEIDSYFSHLRYSINDMNSVKYDLKVSSFFMLTKQDDYRFIHKSFFEFYLAKGAINELYDQNNLNIWKEKWFPKEIASFITGLISSDKKSDYFVQCLFRNILKTDNSILLWNSIHILSLLDSSLVEERITEELKSEFNIRAYNEKNGVIIRQYCRIIGKFWDRSYAEKLIDRVIDIVKNDDLQNDENNETYFNYYGGAKAACQALINHLDMDQPKYDAKLHLYLLECLADEEFCVRLEKVSKKWVDFDKYKMNYGSAIENMKKRNSNKP